MAARATTALDTMLGREVVGDWGQRSKRSSLGKRCSCFRRFVVSEANYSVSLTSDSVFSCTNVQGKQK